ncbi:uncharacterized protein LOC143629083 [Bidens hawaiensis]|uniref:uncharacterized protein LOC143629083 n=1 Tax=Bidens hawaiensis TaxID=980011 RepID=UPI00404AC2AB
MKDIVERKPSYGVGGVMGFTDKQLLHLKRSRVVISDSDSSDEPVRRKVYKIGTGSVEIEEEVRSGKINKDACKIGTGSVETEEEVSNGKHKLLLNVNQRESGSGSSAKDHDELKLRLSSVSNVNEEDGKRKGLVKTEKKQDANAKGRMKSVVKEVKIQRANYTEKQLLREKIKNMLLGAGWTIDYRPRRGRDYLDSVYISPSGSAFWSITKAYDALKKKEKDGSKEGGEFTPLPTEILSKLTRQTRKKLEREIENNGKNEGISISRKSKRAKVKKLAHDKAVKLLERRREESGGVDKERLQKHGLKKSTIRTNSHIVQGEKNRLTLLVRDSEDNVVKRNLLSWLIDSGMVSVGQKVEYMNLRRTRVMQEGWITDDGIHCDCCSKIITISRFELHAGSKLGKPFENIFVKSGKSLMQCQIDGWNKQDESERKGFHAVDVDGDDPNDDTCGKCGDGGDLICCDGCPSTFHLSCLDMQMLPQGDWHCPNCACKYCERVGRYSTKASGRFENSLLTCRLCEKKYHKSCCPDTLDMRTDSNDLSFRFCERKCREVYNRLQKILWVKHELDSGFSWYLIRRSDPVPDVSSVNFSQRVESNSKLAVALSVMDECFLPIIDSRSGISLIHNVVYNCGSNFSRLNYSGFFTAILDKGDEMICAASIRIHGTRLAEMPFIGTRHSYRRQGMCRRLLNAIESALSSLKVEKLVIPAIEEHLHTWTNAFGFSPLEKSEKQEMRSINMLVFPGTDMLYKPLLNKGTSRANITSQKGNKSLELESNNAAKQNGDSSTGNPSESAIRSSRKESDKQSDPNVSKDVILDMSAIVKETGDADSGSKVELNDLQNGNGITDANLLKPQGPDSAARDTVITEVTDSDSISREPGIQFPGKESASVDAQVDNNRNA